MVEKMYKYEQTWDSFEREVKGKKLYIWGIGKLLYPFVVGKAGTFSVDTVLDGDIRKHGTYLSAYVPVEQDVIIQSPEILAGEKDVVVLIMSLAQYEPIVRQLEQWNIDCFFVCKLMEEDDDRLRGSGLSGNTYFVSQALQNPIEAKKVIFYTLGQYGGHGRQIAEKLMKQRKDLDIVWVVNDLKIELPEGVRGVSQFDVKAYIHEMETAGIWIMEEAVPDYLVKREGQTYFQLKHWASITLKTFGITLGKFRHDNYKEEGGISTWIYNGQIIDYLITGSEFDTQTCREGFAYNGEVLQFGSPRSDVLFREAENREKVYREFGIDQQMHTLLYAPTFRHASWAHYNPVAANLGLNYSELKECLEQKFGGTWAIFLRLHPVVAAKTKLEELPEYVIDAGSYSDSEELVAASDIMITDYSSIMFEPAFVGKPVFLFAPDCREYINGERPLLIDYDKLPFDIAESNEDLTNAIERFELDAYQKKLTQFLNSYGVKEDGRAAQRTAEFVNNLINEGAKNG